MLELESGWRIHTDYSPDWLFFRVEHAGAQDEQPSVSESVWSDAERHGLCRLICEIDDSVMMSSHLVGQLLVLHKRAHIEGGRFRVCGISDTNYRVLQLMQLADRFPNYRSREDAVMGHLPDNAF